MQTPDLSLQADEARGSSTRVLRRVLNTLAAETSSDQVCLYRCDLVTNRHELVARSDSADDDRAWSSPPVEWFHLPAGRPHVVDAYANGSLQSAVVWVLPITEHLIGLLALYAYPAHEEHSREHMARLDGEVDIIHLALENDYRRKSQVAAQAIQQAAQIIGSKPALQDLVAILHDSVCSPDVAMCVILLYGPVQEDRPNGPFSYLEVRGSWLKQRGSGVGIGIRFYIDQYLDLIEQLNQDKVLSFPNVRALFPRIDPLIRAFLRGERAQSATLISLNTAQQQIGIIAIVTDKAHEFTLQELYNYRTVSEFLAISAMTEMLYQQRDLVQRGREALLDAVREGIMMVLPGPAQGHVLTVNAFFSRMFNISPQIAQGMTLPELIDRMQIPEDVRGELRREWLSLPVRDPATLQGEFNLMGRDGQPGIIEWYSDPVYQNDRVMGRIYIFHDIAAERAAAVLRANFFSRVSHELRTPLTSIRGFAEFILEAVGDQLPDLAREYTEIILSSAKHLNSVFSDIIEIARADTGQLRMNIETAHLPDTIIEAVALLELDYKQRGQGVIMELDDDLPMVHIDVIRIKQVLTNLLANSIKYSPPNSKIRIITEHIVTPMQLDDSAPPDVVLPAILVTVMDEGPGLSPEEVEQVFLPFYRTDEARASKVEGTGLGLTIARSIIELHRGKIWAEPRRRGRKGARFLFTLPTAET